MSDPKFDTLRESGYNIPVTCGLCVQGHFPISDSLWGTCGAIKCGPKRDAPIVRYGTCPKADLIQDVQFGEHQEFVKRS
jgi:hypothetical protein